MCARVKSWKICFSTGIIGLSGWPFSSRSDSFAESWFCGSRGCNALPSFLLFLRTPHSRGSTFDALGQEGDRDDAVQLRNECGPSRDPCSGSLSVWHSASSSVPTPPLALTPRSVSATQRDIYHSSQACICPVVSMPDIFLRPARCWLKKRTLGNLYSSSLKHGTWSFLPWFPNIRKAILFLHNSFNNLVPCQPSWHILLLCQVHSSSLFIFYLLPRRKRKSSSNMYSFCLLICIPCWITDNIW